jgi:UDPglucose 6-dehydrogenase
MGLDTRIGNRFLEPGPGWGGSCFPKDTKALESIANSFGVELPLITTAIASNETAHKRVADRVA